MRISKNRGPRAQKISVPAASLADQSRGGEAAVHAYRLSGHEARLAFIEQENRGASDFLRSAIAVLGNLIQPRHTGLIRMHGSDKRRFNRAGCNPVDSDPGRRQFHCHHLRYRDIPATKVEIAGAIQPWWRRNAVRGSVCLSRSGTPEKSPAVLLAEFGFFGDQFTM